MANWPTCSAAAARSRACRRTPALILCLITDRRRLQEVARLPSWDAALLAQVEGAVRGGVDIVQIRERDLRDRDLARLLERALDLARGSGTRIVVNDRADIALACGAHGVHLREDSVDPAQIRRLAGRTWLVGRSIHTPEAAGRFADADYLLAGSVFVTRSKPGLRPALGLDGLRQAVVAASGRPVWAVGGITAARAREVVRTGVHGIAAIDAFLPASGSRQVAASVEKNALTMRFSFDSTDELS